MISHWTAARLWGGVVPDNEWTHISFMRDVRFRVRGIKHHRFRHRLDIKRRHGLPVTSPASDVLSPREAPGLVDLVALGDRLVKKGRCTPSELVDYADAWPGQCRGEALGAARLVRERVDSVPETALRLLMVLAGLPEPQVDIRIHDADGQVRFRIDLGFEGFDWPSSTTAGGTTSTSSASATRPGAPGSAPRTAGRSWSFVRRTSTRNRSSFSSDSRRPSGHMASPSRPRCPRNGAVTSGS